MWIRLIQQSTSSMMIKCLFYIFNICFIRSSLVIIKFTYTLFSVRKKEWCPDNTQPFGHFYKPEILFIWKRKKNLFDCFEWHISTYYYISTRTIPITARQINGLCIGSVSNEKRCNWFHFGNVERVRSLTCLLLCCCYYYYYLSK